jgi:hypothetical protein
MIGHSPTLQCQTTVAGQDIPGETVSSARRKSPARHRDWKREALTRETQDVERTKTKNLKTLTVHWIIPVHCTAFRKQEDKHPSVYTMVRKVIKVA